MALLLGVTGVLTAACGGSSNPSPTAPADSPGTVGATISGSVRVGSSASLVSSVTANTVPGLTVAVVGTSITSGLDAAGRFALRNVPAGDVQLQFSGPASGTVPISQVQPQETIDLVLAVASSSVVIESQFRATAGEEQLEGRIESLPPTMAANTMKVGGRTVRTDAATQLRQGGIVRTFGDLEVGYRVHVKGRTDGGSLLASSVEIQNVNTTIPVNLNGVVSAMSGTQSAFQFEVNGRLVKGDTSTEFFGGSTFSGLKNDARVEVKGQQRDGYVYAERIHVNTDGPDTPQEESASIHGRITSIGGSVPSLTLMVGGTTVRTDTGTIVQRRGDVQSLDTLRVGMDVHVVGVRRPDGSIDARRVQINDDPIGGEVEIEGSVGGLSGSCPAVSFKINGFSITTTSATTFDVPCGNLRNGAKVKVNGTSQADGSVRATRVRPS